MKGSISVNTAHILLDGWIKTIRSATYSLSAIRQQLDRTSDLSETAMREEIIRLSNVIQENCRKISAEIEVLEEHRELLDQIAGEEP